MDKEYREKFSRLVATDIKQVDDLLLFSQSTWNGLYIINKWTKEVIYNSIIKKEYFAGVMLYYSLQIIESKIIFIPHSASHIAVFDYKYDTWDYLRIKDCKKDYHEEYRDTAKFAKSFQYEKFVYLLGYSYPAIIKLDTQTLKISYITDWVESVDKYVSNNDGWGYFSDGCVFQENKVILPLGCMKGLLELELSTCRTKLIHPEISIKNIGGIKSFDQRKIWITPRGESIGRIALWDTKYNKYFEIELPDYFQKIGSYYAPIYVQGRIYLFPEYRGHIYEINEESITVEICEKLDTILQRNPKMPYMYPYLIAPYTDGTNIIFITGFDYKWHIFNPMTGNYKEYFIDGKINLEKYFSERIEIISKKMTPLNELELGLGNYIIGISKAYRKIEKRPGLFGPKIYEEVCNSSRI